MIGQTPSSQPTLRSVLAMFLASLFAAGTLFGEFASASGDLEREIEAEVLRQEEMIQSRDPDGQAGHTAREHTARRGSFSEQTDFRTAPLSPVLRKLPLALFESEEIEVSAGHWDNSEPLTVIRRTLDVDRDGIPEQLRFFDPVTGALIRREADRNYDGAIDIWERFAEGSVVERRLDSNGDGRIDVWESYRAGRMSERAIDRNTDGEKDAFFTFTGEFLTEERHDRNGDGDIDLIVTYRNRRKIHSQEDRSDDGQIDTWIYYERVEREDIPNRIERDSNASGTIDTVDLFDTSSGKSILSQREEDKNDDGEVDVTSRYRDGKLYRREISDPNLIQ
jgi:hypothetical protein